MSDDLATRLAAIETRVALLERALLQRGDTPHPGRTEPPPILWPMTLPATGCVCPVGAEFNCFNGMCPRRGPIYATGAQP